MRASGSTAISLSSSLADSRKSAFKSDSKCIGQHVLRVANVGALPCHMSGLWSMLGAAPPKGQET